MINEKLFNELKSVISDPAWKLIIQRLAEHLEYADKKVHQATKDTFDYVKGYYDCALFIYRLFKEPKNLAEDGIMKIKTETEA